MAGPGQPAGTALTPAPQGFNRCVRQFKDEMEMIGEGFDLGISVNYWKIIREPLLSCPVLGFVNVHHSYNLRFRGRNCTTHAIIRARKDNVFPLCHSNLKCLQNILT